MSDLPWRVVVMAPARREFDRLSISVAAAVLETLETLDAIAEHPSRLGKPLMLEHEGRFSRTEASTSSAGPSPSH